LFAYCLEKIRQISNRKRDVLLARKRSFDLGFQYAQLEISWRRLRGLRKCLVFGYQIIWLLHYLNTGSYFLAEARYFMIENMYSF
jgi:hypothetical protein